MPNYKPLTWRVLKVHVGLTNPTPIHYLGTDHTEGNTFILSGQVLGGSVGAS